MKAFILAIFLFLATRPVSAGNHYDSNPFIDMMRAMLNMFETMQAVQNFSAHGGYRQDPRSYLPPTSTWPSPAPREQANPELLAQLEGSWASPNRLLLVIKQRYARMYWSADQYRNFYLEVFPGRLKLTDAQTQQSQEFEFRLQGQQLALRDPRGRILQFFRVGGDTSMPPPAPATEEYNFWDPNSP